MSDLCNEITEIEVAEIIAILESATGKPSPPKALEVWCIAFKGLPAVACQQAVEQFISENTYPVFPVPGAIRQRAVKLMNPPLPMAEAAFASVLSAISEFGYVSPGLARDSLGPAIWSIIEGTGGWIRYCDSPTDQRGTLFAQFRDAWKGLCMREEQQRLLPEHLRSSSADQSLFANAENANAALIDQVASGLSAVPASREVSR